MRWLGNLACATTATNPMEMTVSQSGVAYVPQDANIYRANLWTLARTRTPYIDGQLGFSVGSIAISPSDDRLYMLGTIGDMGTPTVAVSDTRRLSGASHRRHRARLLAEYDSLVDAEMNTFGRIFALTFQGGNLAQIDPTTGTTARKPDG